jgi:hypothetical protein
MSIRNNSCGDSRAGAGDSRVQSDQTDTTGYFASARPRGTNRECHSRPGFEAVVPVTALRSAVQPGQATGFDHHIYRSPGSSGQHGRHRDCCTATRAACVTTSCAILAGASGRLRFRHVGRDRIHQRRRQTIKRLQPEFLETRSNARHRRWGDARLDYGRHKRGKPRGRRAGFLE